MQRILGVDPGSLSTGYAIIESDGRTNRYIASGQIKTIESAAMHERLADIYDGIARVISNYHPSTMTVENVFMSKNANSALKLGQARGVAICAAAKAGLTVHEYSARFVKKAITGNGGADKVQVQYMVCHLLGIAKYRQKDESDALAIALSHAFSGLLKKIPTHNQ